MVNLKKKHVLMVKEVTILDFKMAAIEYNEHQPYR